MSGSRFAKTPEPPYFAVIFASQRTPADDEGYGAMAERMLELGSQQPGFLGIESVRDEQGFGITVSYWETEEAIRAWKADAEHRVAQQQGHRAWYEHIELRVAHVTRARSGPARAQTETTSLSSGSSKQGGSKPE
jgi:heme-degrading monooxygenase HmoA